MMKTLSLVLATCSMALCSNVEANTQFFKLAKTTQENTPDSTEGAPAQQKRAEIIDLEAGNYLASRFAQAHHDWKSANNFINPILTSDLSHGDIIYRAMIISMGAGDHDRAIKLAEQTKANSNKSTIADVFLLVDAFKHNDIDKAMAIYKTLPQDPTIRFIGPFVKAWLDAANGEINIKNLRQNTIQLYHGILISDFLNDHKDIEKMIEKAMDLDDVSAVEVERIADLYGHVGMKDKAISLYQSIIKKNPESENNQFLENKIDNLNKGTDIPLFKKIKTVQHGMAQAFYDIAKIMYNENNDDSARVFGNVALYLAPDMSETLFLLADINARHKQYDAAISLYKTVPKEDDNFLQAQFDIVDIYEDTEQFDEALSVLKRLSEKDKKPDTLIKIGDLYRHRSEYKTALDWYNKAVSALGGSVTKDYWHLHYVRGIAYEQTDRWKKAETELSAALEFQPDHPYILNYLGYSWVDRGVNLDKATEMIQRAVNLKPNDGYITDSLGWAQYRNADYKGAVKSLERAVELLPYDPTVNDHLGDAYWQVNRKLEARFQWERAKNNSNDDNQIKAIEEKLVNGLKTDI
ncbi:MAG: tetratricopeptide repeat protein [Alcanivorax sp.]